MKYESFQDIPQFPRSYYQINCSWGYLGEQILGLAPNGVVDFDPPYQRGYVWSGEQKSRWVEYILRGGVSGRDVYFNCPNWQFHSPIVEGWENTLELVDGKQRIGAVRGFLAGEVPAFGRFFGEYGGHLRDVTVDMRIHVGCLQTRLEVVDWYLGMNNGGTAHSASDLQVALDYRASLVV